MISDLLDPDPTARLGGTNGVEALQELPLLADVRWAELGSGTAKSPLLPRIAEYIRSASAQDKGTDASFTHLPVGSLASAWCDSEFPK